MKCIGFWWLLLALVLFILDTCAWAKPCPIKCLCDLLRQPRKISCTGRGLQKFPENISDVVKYNFIK